MNNKSIYKFDFLKEETIRRIIPVFQPEKIIFFGSYAKGNATADSDLDILLEFSEIDNKRKLTIQIRKLFTDFPIAKDILVMSREEVSKYKEMKWSVYCNAIEEGRVIYERK